MKHLYVLFSFLPFFVFSQNGPGGVGSSANNVMWLDANRGITLSGSNVTNWADQSGNGFNAVPSSTLARPTVSATSANGNASIKFDGTDDELWVNDNNALDLTQWHFFIVPQVDFQKNYNAWLTKGDDSQENYEMLSFSDGNLHSPIFFTDGVRTFSSSAGGQATTTEFNILEYTYSAAVGRDLYKNFTLITTDNENRTPAVNTASLYIGNEKATTGRFMNGKMAEIIMYNAPLNSAQRIIVNNYLAAKYNCTLTASDLYTMDTPANGNFDNDVAGIGRVDVSNQQLDSKGQGIVRILNAVGLGDGEFYIWGHNGAALGTYTTGDFPAGVQARLARVWRGSEIGTINNFDVQFDLSGLGPVTASDLRLLIDVDNNGAFANETVGGGGIVSGASLVSGSIYQFTGVTGLNNNIRFTLGTTNFSATPLPVTLSNFTAVYNKGQVNLNWTTVSEKNNNFFTVERAQGESEFEAIAAVKAYGNSNSKQNYSATDLTPHSGITYYRLKQTDTDGSFSYSGVVITDIKPNENYLLFPNPSGGSFTIDLTASGNEQVSVLISDTRGKHCFSKTINANRDQRFYTVDTQNQLSPGTYLVKIIMANKTYNQTLIIE